MVFGLTGLEDYALVIGMALSTLGILSIIYSACGKVVFKTVSEPISKAQIDIEKLCTTLDSIKNDILSLRSDIVALTADYEILERRSEHLLREIEDHEDRLRMCETVMTVVKYKCDCYKGVLDETPKV